jgi:hypothetical protein
LTTAITVALPLAHRTAFRVAARDAAGNWSAAAVSASSTPSGWSDRSPTITYTGSWPLASSSSYWGGTVRYSTVTGASVRYQFTGRGFAWVAPRGPKRGRAAVTLDGVLIGSFDLVSRTFQPSQIVFGRWWAASGTHTVTIRVDGTETRPRIDIDGFVTIR